MRRGYVAGGVSALGTESLSGMLQRWIRSDMRSKTGLTLDNIKYTRVKVDKLTSELPGLIAKGRETMCV